MGEVISWLLHPYETATAVLTGLPPSLVGKVGGLISILQAIGIALLAYIIFLAIKGVLTFKRLKKISNIESKLEELDKKIDVLINRNSEKSDKKTKKIKK